LTASCQPPGWVLSAAPANRPGPKTWVPCVGDVRVVASPPSEDNGSTTLLASRCLVVSPVRARRPSPESPRGETPLTSLPRRNGVAWPNSDWFPTPTTVMLWPPKRPPRHSVEANISTEALMSTSPFLLPAPRGKYLPEQRTLLDPRVPRCRSTLVHPSPAPASPGLARKRARPRSADRYTASGPTSPSESGRNHHLPEVSAARSPAPPATPVAGSAVQCFFRGAANFKALLHRRVRSVSAPFPAPIRPILPWALLPYVSPQPGVPVAASRPPKRAASAGSVGARRRRHRRTLRREWGGTCRLPCQPIRANPSR
jgi:hypothetical protein